MKKIIRTAFSFIRKAAGSVASERRRKSARIAALGGDLEFIYNAIADEAGYNITYVESMNGSLFPSVLALAEGKTDGDGHEFVDCRFLAENGFILPKRLRKAPDWRIKAYIRLHLDTVLDLIEAEAESDYYSRIGEHYNTHKDMQKRKRYRLLESWHNGCDNAENDVYAESASRQNLEEILTALHRRFLQNGLGDGFSDSIPNFCITEDGLHRYWLGDPEETLPEFCRNFRIVEVDEDPPRMGLHRGGGVPGHRRLQRHRASHQRAVLVPFPYPCRRRGSAGEVPYLRQPPDEARG